MCPSPHSHPYLLHHSHMHTGWSPWGSVTSVTTLIPPSLLVHAIMCPHNSQGVWIVVPELAPCPSSFWFSSKHNTKEKMSPDNPKSHRGWVDDIGNQHMPLDPDHISCMLEALAASDADDEGTGGNLGALGGIWHRFRRFRSKLDRGIIPAHHLLHGRP